MGKQRQRKIRARIEADIMQAVFEALQDVSRGIVQMATEHAFEDETEPLLMWSGAMALVETLVEMPPGTTALQDLDNEVRAIITRACNQQPGFLPSGYNPSGTEGASA